MNVPNELLTAFDFDALELEANRSGKFTDKQLRNINPNLLWYVGYKVSRSDFRILSVRAFRFLLNLVAILEIGVLLLFAIWVVWNLENELNKVGYVLLLVILEPALVWLIIRSSRKEQYLSAHRVATIEGIVKLIPSGINKRPILKLNRRQFQITNAQLSSLRTGNRYRLYFVGNRILSVEPSNVAT